MVAGDGELEGDVAAGRREGARRLERARGFAVAAEADRALADQQRKLRVARQGDPRALELGKRGRAAALEGQAARGVGVGLGRLRAHAGGGREDRESDGEEAEQGRALRRSP